MTSVMLNCFRKYNDRRICGRREEWPLNCSFATMYPWWRRRFLKCIQIKAIMIVHSYVRHAAVRRSPVLYFLEKWISS